jgi:threonine synthase
LGEGGTPLIEAPALAKLLDVGSVHLKFEGMNPTGSFKDRGMTTAVSKALGDGAKAVIAASTGNTSAAAAAYAVKAGMQSVVLVPGRQDLLGEAVPGCCAQSANLAGQGKLRRLPETCSRAQRKLPSVLGELGKPKPSPGSEDSGI